jgi:hypothetical protein
VPGLRPVSQREAEAAKDLLLTRLMSVHPEVYGGAQIRLADGGRYLAWYVEVELSKPVPKYVKLPSVFMGVGVVYKPTGWTPEPMPYHEQ